MISREYSFRASFHLPSDDVRRKLELSRRETEGMDSFEIKCPICYFILEEVYGVKQGYVNIKCQKCKFQGPLNLAYFRRQKKTRDWHWF